jgi:transposase
MMMVPAFQPVDIVVINNLASQKGKGVAERIETASAKLWHLPPNSPDLYPIERMWSKVRSLPKKTKARTQTTLYDAIGVTLRGVSTTELAYYYAATG